YNHKFDSLKAFAQHIALKDKSLRTAQAYYRKIRLVSEHFDEDPKLLVEEQIASYILHLKEVKRWAPSTVRQSIACMTLFYNDMLGRQWRLWEVVKMRERRKLPVVLNEKLENRLPVEHYMVTFTLPSQLRKLCRYQAKDFLKLFFASSA
ncbi:phage integrase N-terminal SAM-like domain-containing protein, partial [Puniceicoccaceae bacterium K14]|nr:phage integrase N-terminal SAM-like domain-containing protein [Puniceicoccaceae bacterium K14]